MNLSNISLSRGETDQKRKLERLLGTTRNLRDLVNLCREKNANDIEVIEDITSIANLSNNLMKLSEQIFRYYLVVPVTASNDSAPMLLGSKKNEALIKYENNLSEEHKQKIEDNYSYSMDYNESENLEKNTKLISSMDDLSKALCDKLKDSSKKLIKSTDVRQDENSSQNPEERRKIQEKIHTLNKWLNKK